MSIHPLCVSYLPLGDRSAATVGSTKQVMPSVKLKSTAIVRNQRSEMDK
jgi:hypothetical protein